MKKTNKNNAAKPAARSTKKGGGRKNIQTPIFKRPIICPPDMAGTALKTRVLGYGCRALVIFFAVFGIVFFVIDALRLDAQNISVSAGYIALVCLAAVALFSLMRLSRYGALGGSVLISVVILLFVLLADDVPGFILSTLVTAKNVALTRLYNLGYYTMADYMTPINYTSRYNAEYYLKVAVALFAVLLALAFVMSTLKRVRVFLPAAISTIILGVVFTYNISRSNWGVVLIIASFTGLIVMAAYDSIFTIPPDKKLYDTETAIFYDPNAPKPPEKILSRQQLRQKKREERKKRIEKLVVKDEHIKNVDEELSDYFSRAEQKKSRPKKVKKAVKADGDDEERQKQKKEASEYEIWQKYSRRVHNAKVARGGFAALGAFAVAFLMLLLPALTVDSSFSTIDVIDKRMEYYREYVTALLMGDDPILDELGYQNNKNNFVPRPVDAKHIYYTGAKVFTVETIHNTNVYLRGWIGVDYKDGSWYPVSTEQLEAYRKLYSTRVDPSGSMFDNFYNIIDPSLVEDKDFSSRITSAANYGFVAMQVNISRGETGNTLLYLPAFLRVDDDMTAARADAYGLYEYGTNTPKKDATFVNFFDGIYTGRKFAKEISYGAVAYVTTMRNSNWYKNVSGYIADYNVGYNDAIAQIAKYASRREQGRNASLDEIVDAIFVNEPENLLSVETNPEAGTKIIKVQYDGAVGVYTYDINTGELINKRAEDVVPEIYVDPITGETEVYTRAFIPPALSLHIRYRELMTQQEKRELAYAYYYQYMYAKFVYSTYLGKSGSPIIKNVLNEIISSATETVAVPPSDDDPNALTTYIEVQKDLSRAAEVNAVDPEVYEQRHELVLEIVNYLRDSMTYTLTPNLDVDSSLDGVENFLTVTKEGYCVQYASALTLLLREAGIPARYVEGYIAADFRRNYSPDAVGRYITTVRDYNAHAWVEVWYDGIGWVQYEATSVYYSEMYEKSIGEGSGTVVRPGAPIEEMTEEEELLASLLSSIDLADALIETMRDDSALLIGGEAVRAALDSIAKRVSYYREEYQKLADSYAQNKDSQNYDAASIIGEINSLIESFENDVGAQLQFQQMRLDSLAATTRIVWLSSAGAVLLIVLIVISLILRSRAKHAEDQRIAELKLVSQGGFTDDNKAEHARRTIDRLMQLLKLYGTPPETGEFRHEYAERISHEYIDIFSRAPKNENEPHDEKTGLVCDVDFAGLFDAIAEEEFGYGMGRDDLMKLAEVVLRLEDAAEKRLGRSRRIVLRYFKRLI